MDGGRQSYTLSIHANTRLKLTLILSTKRSSWIFVGGTPFQAVFKAFNAELPDPLKMVTGGIGSARTVPNKVWQLAQRFIDELWANFCEESPRGLAIWGYRGLFAGNWAVLPQNAC